MKRREFMSWVGVGTLAASLPVALAACQSEDTPVRPDGFTAVGTVADLDQKGSLSRKNFGDGALLVIRDPADPTQAIALNPICTHKGCTTEWKADQGLLECPCHGAKFKTDGTVANGPAARPIGVYGAKIEGDTVLVKGPGK